MQSKAFRSQFLTQKKRWQNFSDACCSLCRQMQSCVFKLGYFFYFVKAALRLLKENEKLHIEVAASVSCGTTLQRKLDLMTPKGQK